MSERDEGKGSDDSGKVGSPYDDPTGRFELPHADDRDSFYDRYAAKGKRDLRKVDDLDDIDSADVDTTAARTTPVPAATTPPADDPETLPLTTPTEPIKGADDSPADGATAVAATSSTDATTSRISDDEFLPLDPVEPAGSFEPVHFVDPTEPEHAADAPTAVLTDSPDEAGAPADARRGTVDVGLLLLRVVVGVIAMAHGSQKLFGWWDGPRLSGFETYLTNPDNPALGFDDGAARVLAIVGAVSELVGGMMLVAGLFTPIAAAAVLGVMLVATTFKATTAGYFAFFAGDSAGLEFEILLVVCAAAIILCGPGLISLDTQRGWARRPMWGSIAMLVVAIAAAVTIWVVFNGTNPFTSSGS